MWQKTHTIKTLQNILNNQTINQIQQTQTDNINQWIQAGLKIGEEKKLSELHKKSLAGKLASFATGQPITTNTENQIKEGTIDEIFFKKYETLQNTSKNEDEQFQTLITEIIIFYTKGKAKDYELSIYRVNGNVSQSDVEDYDKVPGSNAKEKLHFLIQHYDPNKEINYFGSYNVGARIDSYLTYSDYMVFKGIPVDSTRKKVHVLLECYKSYLLG